MVVDSGVKIHELETYFGVGITKLDGNIPYELVFESDSHDPRDGFHHCRLSVSDMANRTWSFQCKPIEPQSRSEAHATTRTLI